jgi:hypothetical protein
LKTREHKTSDGVEMDERLMVWQSNERIEPFPVNDDDWPYAKLFSLAIILLKKCVSMYHMLTA